MAFFKFGKKEEKRSEPFEMPMPQEPSMNEQVSMMRQQGYSNGQIAQALSSQGHNPVDINNAINQASMGSNFPNAPPEMGMSDFGRQQYEQYPEQGQQLEQYNAANFSQPSYPTPPMPNSPSLDEERIQEIAEAIIDEKWDEFAKDIKKVIEWKEKSEDRLAKLEQQMIDIRMSIDSLSKSIMGKISSYDQNIVDVGTEIKAMEKVFQKVLPSLTENVNKLERMTKDSKGNIAPRK